MYELIGRLKVLELVPLQIESRERKREGSKVQREHLPVNVRKANKVVWRLAPFGVFGALLPGISTLFLPVRCVRIFS